MVVKVGFFRREKKGAEEVNRGNGVDVYHVNQSPMDDEAADGLEKDPGTFVCGLK